jgi:hypothetical protein
MTPLKVASEISCRIRNLMSHWRVLMSRFLMAGVCVFWVWAACAAPAPVENCPQARDPARCVARQQAQGECQGLRGRARQQCLLNHLPPPDCSVAEEPARCQQRQQARIACKGKTGKAWRACLNEQAGSAHGQASGRPND